jgi:hypothetical protein
MLANTGRGMGVVENKHSTFVGSPSPPPCICMSIHLIGKSCSDLVSSACSQGPSCAACLTPLSPPRASKSRCRVGPGE